MSGRKFVLYFSWNRDAEINADLGILDNRFPALFEFRRILWPEFESLAGPRTFNQGVRGFVDDVILGDFKAFAAHVEVATGNPVRVVERQRPDGTSALDAAVLRDCDTVIVVSLDHMRTGQQASAGEIKAVHGFLSDPKNIVVVCPHHDIGDVSAVPATEALSVQEVEFRHHGDPTIPPQQRFSGFGRSLLEGLGIEVENRFGLNPAKATDGAPGALQIDVAADRLQVLQGVTTFNLHPHLPHLEGTAESVSKYDVLARQPINREARLHPFTRDGRYEFDALLQTRADVFAGTLLVCDATLWSSAFGGLQSLKRFWSNLAQALG